MHVSASALWSQRVLDPLELELQAGMHHPVDTGITSESSAQRASVLNCRATSSGLVFLILLLNELPQVPGRNNNNPGC